MKRKNKWITTIVAAAVIFAVLPGYGFSQGIETADDRIVIGKRVKLRSGVLQEERTLLVHAPPDYHYSRARYPVLYVLDGNSHFHHVTGIVRYLSGQRSMPQMMVVAVTNTQRNRDFLPTRMAHIPSSGGGNSFLKFIETELIPFIDKNYRTQPYRLLAGHSFGGFFTVYTLLTRPALFDAYIAVSPSLHWDNLLALRLAVKFFEQKLSFKKFLYMTMGDETDTMMKCIENFCQILEKKAPPDFKWHYRYMKKEDHNSTPLRSIYDGLEMLYSGWRLPQKSFTAGLKAILKHYKGLSRRYGYEIPLPENLLNRLGYSLLGRGKIEAALDIFKHSVRLFPDSPNVYDSLGEAYEAVHRLEEAKKNYEIACRKAKEVNHPHAEIFESHLLRVTKRIASSR